MTPAQFNEYQRQAEVIEQHKKNLEEQKLMTSIEWLDEQIQESYNRGLMDGRLNNIDYSITYGFTPIELPTWDDVRKAIYMAREERIRYIDNGFGISEEHKFGYKMKEEEIIEKIKQSKT